MFLKKARHFILFALLLLPAIALSSQSHINLIKVDSIINPIVAEFISRSIEASEKDGALALVIELDTPGGLDLAMRSIVKDILNSPVPVIVYVHPGGARAASAGVMITMAAHVAAMSPATNIGAAHPVNLGVGGEKADETMMKKIENDAAAYARGIAEKKGRNARWAEKAVRESVSITADKAKELKVIDIVAPTLDALIEEIERKEVLLADEKKVTLALKDAERKYLEMDFRQKILSTISDPNIAYILMMVGFLGLYLELSNPGLIFPGVVGGVSLILAFVAFQTLPVNYAGVLLVVLGIVLLFLELMVISYGLLTMGGIGAILLGSLMLFERSAPFLRVSYVVIFSTVAALSVIFIFVITMAVKTFSRHVATGLESLIGLVGEARTVIDKRGKVFVHGELWEAKSDEIIEKGEKVEVKEIKGMLLSVKKAEE
ncbi:MAG: nodulation protein NfeD [Deltaproteobacteria bacterium]|nr:nodulation protein NfeD [Deltaproteobacteria bacterium]